MSESDPLLAGYFDPDGHTVIANNERRPLARLQSVVLQQLSQRHDRTVETWLIAEAVYPAPKNWPPDLSNALKLTVCRPRQQKRDHGRAGRKSAAGPAKHSRS